MSNAKGSAAKHAAKLATKPKKKKQNPLGKDGSHRVHFTDIPLLRKFISDRGKIRSSRVTGLSPQEQRDVAAAIKNAREMALLPYTSSAR